MTTYESEEGESIKVGEFNARKRWFDHLRKRFGLKNQDNRKSSSAS